VPDYSDWRYIFTSSWDAVTGEIPGDWVCGEGIIPEDPLDQLGTIMKRSREILYLEFLNTDDPAFTCNTKVLSPADHFEIQEEIHKAAADIAENGPQITPGYIKLVRYIFGSSRGIYQYLDYYDGPECTDKVVESARHIVPRETPAYIILAVLALKFSYMEAGCLVLHEKQPNLPKAWVLLHAAEQAEGQETIEYLTPLAERERRTREGRAKGAKTTQAKTAPSREDCRALAKKLRDAHPTWKPHRVAKHVSEEKKIPLSTIQRYLGLRK
jgi:hypothetical protein